MTQLRTSQLKGFAIRLTITDLDGNAHTYLRRRKKSILAVLVNWDQFKKAHILVRYTPKFHNEGVYTSKEDLVKAYQIFTEKDLILDIVGSK
jgi:hypothetical protein